MCYILYFGGKIEAFQVWEEGGLKLPLPPLVPFRRRHSPAPEIAMMDVWGLLSRPSERSFNLPTHVLWRGGRGGEEEDL